MPESNQPSKRTPRAHRVTGTLENIDLTKASTALTLKLEHKSGKLGELEIGRGSVTWYGRNRRNGVSWTWTEFAAFMEKHGYGD